MVRRLRKASSGRDVPTYAENLLCILVDSGEAEEAEALLVAPGDSPLRFAGSTCLSAGVKKYGEYDLKKKLGCASFASSHTPCSCSPGVCATDGIVSRRNVGQIITLDWNHRLYFQDAIEWDTFSRRMTPFVCAVFTYKQGLLQIFF